MNAVVVDFGVAFLAACSAACWAKSASIQIPPLRADGGEAQGVAFRVAAKWNGLGAALASLSVVTGAIKTCLVSFGML
jgi:hypothetical protein